MNQETQAYLNRHRPRVGVRGIYRNPSDSTRDYDFKITRIDGTIAHTINVKTGESSLFIWAFPRPTPKESHLNTLHHWTGKEN